MVDEREEQRVMKAKRAPNEPIAHGERVRALCLGYIAGRGLSSMRNVSDHEHDAVAVAGFHHGNMAHNDDGMPLLHFQARV